VTGPMQGIKVVELGIWVAGPAAGSILADWGADVIKIEAPGGDPLRAASAAVLSPDVRTNPHFNADNRGKRSLVLDLRTEEGRNHLLILLDSADVFISNVRAAGLARLGLDPESVLARNPRLVYAAITGYGLSGPKTDVAGSLTGSYPDELKILLAHNPIIFREAWRHGIDLTLSGHTHGGQIKLRPEEKRLLPRRKRKAGLHQRYRSQLYITRGIGTVVVPMRYQCPPEISLLELRCVE